MVPDVRTTPQGSLSIAISTDRDGDTRLQVSAESYGFSGTTAFWWGDLDGLGRFASEIATYPLDADSRNEFVAGYGDPADGSLSHEFIRITVEPFGRHGQVRFDVALAADDVLYTALPASAVRHEVHLEIRTTYERLRHFSNELHAMADGRADSALIEAEEVG